MCPAMKQSLRVGDATLEAGTDWYWPPPRRPLKPLKPTAEKKGRQPLVPMPEAD